MPKTILLADDSVTIQKVIGISFANEDVVLLTVDNGNDAVVRAREERPDIVLADIVMPGKSGYEVCEELKGDPALRHVPVLLLSGTFECFDEGRAEQVGADGHITKPFEAQMLIEQVNALLGGGGDAATPRQEPKWGGAEADSPAPLPPAEDAEGSAELYDLFDDELPPLPESGEVRAEPASISAGVEANAHGLIPPPEEPGELGATPSDEIADPAESRDASAELLSHDNAFEVMSGFEIPNPVRAKTPAPAELDPEPDAAQFDPLSELTAETGEDAEDLEAELFGDLSLSDDEAEPFAVPEETAPPRPDAAPFATPPTADYAAEPTAADENQQIPETEDLSAMEDAAAEPVAEAAPTNQPADEAPPSPVTGETLTEGSLLEIVQPDDLVAEPMKDLLSNPENTVAALGPGLREELRETLEKVAWDAMGDLSERIVREAVERVEAAAWEVVPQLAEILIREEIRRIKGEP